MAVLGRTGNRYDPGPVAPAPIAVASRVAMAVRILSGLLCDLTEAEAMEAFRKAKSREEMDARDDLDGEV